MTVPHTEQDAEGDFLAPFRARVAHATAAMLAAVDAEPERVWNPRDLRELAGGGTAAMTALCTLANPEHDGRLELLPNLDVRKSRPSTEEERDA